MRLRLVLYPEWTWTTCDDDSLLPVLRCHGCVPPLISTVLCKAFWREFVKRHDSIISWTSLCYEEKLKKKKIENKRDFGNIFGFFLNVPELMNNSIFIEICICELYTCKIITKVNIIKTSPPKKNLQNQKIGNTI